MHEETRRRLLRVAFLIVCIVPTVGVMTWAVLLRTPWPARRMSQWLSTQSGMLVGLQRLDHLRPDQVQLTGLQIRDPETLESCVEIAELTATRGAGGWQVHLTRLSLDGADLRLLWERFDERLVRSGLRSQAVLSAIRCDRLTIELPGGPCEIADVVWTRDDDRVWHHSQLTFALASPANASPARLTIQRAHDQPPAVTRIQLDTGEQRLPVALLAALAGHPTELPGTFRGTLPLALGPHGFNATAEGEFEQLSLSSLAPWIPDPLTGTADLKKLHLQFDQRGVLRGSGILQARTMTASERFVQRLMAIKLFTPGPAYRATNTAHDSLKIDTLDLRFSIAENGVICMGIRDPANLIVAARGAAGPLLLCDAHLRVDWLIDALIPRDSDRANLQATRLQRLLPRTTPNRRL